MLVYVAGQVSGLVPRGTGWRRGMFERFGRWFILVLKFALAADIVRSVITPTWNDIGQIAAIAVIRTFLNYFLARDAEEARGLEGLIVADWNFAHGTGISSL